MKKILNQSARSSVKRYRYESTGGANSSLRSFLISSAAFATFRCWSRGNRISTFRLGLKTGSVPLQVHQDSTSCSQTTRAIASAVSLGFEKSVPEVRSHTAFIPSTDSFRARGCSPPKLPRPSLPPSVNPPRCQGWIHYFRIQGAYRTHPDHDLWRSWRFSSGAVALAFLRNSRRNVFGARSVATVSVTGGRPAAWCRKNTSVRR